MTLTQLRYLVAIADSGLNITQAAERVHATQPGLSKQLKQLEDELGFQLFTRKGRSPKATWIWKVAIWSFPFSLAAMSVGWIFTEMGRQPWLVFGLLRTQDGVSPNVTGLTILISLIAFTLVYGVLAVVEFRLITRAVRKGPEDAPVPDPETGVTTVVYEQLHRMAHFSGIDAGR